MRRPRTAAKPPFPSMMKRMAKTVCQVGWGGFVWHNELEAGVDGASSERASNWCQFVTFTIGFLDEWEI